MPARAAHALSGNTISRVDRASWHRSPSVLGPGFWVGRFAAGSPALRKDALTRSWWLPPGHNKTSRTHLRGLTVYDPGLGVSHGSRSSFPSPLSPSPLSPSPLSPSPLSPLSLPPSSLPPSSLSPSSLSSSSGSHGVISSSGGSGGAVDGGALSPGGATEGGGKVDCLPLSASEIPLIGLATAFPPECSS